MLPLKNDTEEIELTDEVVEKYALPLLSGLKKENKEDLKLQ